MHINGLKELTQEQKEGILDEIEFFFSPKGFIDGVSLSRRFEGVLGIEGKLDKNKVSQIMCERNRGKK
jgi:hypothetical protein